MGSYEVMRFLSKTIEPSLGQTFSQLIFPVSKILSLFTVIGKVPFELSKEGNGVRAGPGQQMVRTFLF